MKKISVTISGHRTSITLEDAFVDALRAIAKKQKKSIAEIISEIDKGRNKSQLSTLNSKLSSNLSSATRVWVLRQLQS